MASEDGTILLTESRMSACLMRRGNGGPVSLTVLSRTSSLHSDPEGHTCALPLDYKPS